MRRVVGALVVVWAAVGAGPAWGAVVVRNGPTLEVTGDAADETVTLTAPEPDTIRVASPQGVAGDCSDCAVDPNATVRVSLGAGHDSVDASALKRAVVVSLDDGGDTVATGSGDDAIAVVGTDNVVRAGAGGDVITGAGELHGEAGDDYLNGGGLLDGGAGDDRLIGVIATFAGGPGRDIAQFSLSGPVHMSLDGVENDGAGSLRASNVLADVEVLEGGASDDVFDTRDGAAERVECGSGDDAVTADRIDEAASDCERVTLPSEPTLTPTAIQAPAVTAAPAPPAVVAAVTAPLVPDHSPPTVAVKLAKRPRHGVRARVRCSEACSISAVLRIGARTAKRRKLPAVLGRAKARLTHVGTVTLTVKPRAARLRHVKRLRATLVTMATDVDGDVRRVTRALTLIP